MGEVATVAAIAGGILTSGITAWVTSAGSKRATAVELIGIAAESERLQSGNREEERRHRQSVYQRHVLAMNDIYRMMGFPARKTDFDRVCDAYQELSASVVLLSPLPVRDAASAVERVYSEIWAAYNARAVRKPTTPPSELWELATTGLKQSFGERLNELTKAMSQDVTRGIVDDPPGQAV